MTISTERISNVFQTAHRDNAESHHHQRTASLSDVERAVLSALFIDTPTPSIRPEPMQQRRVLDDTILFSIPQGLSEETEDETNKIQSSAELTPKRPAVRKKPKDYRLQVGLWQAHEDGVTPKILSRMTSIASSTREEDEDADTDEMDSYHFSAQDDDDDKDDDASSNSRTSMKILPGSQSSLSWDESDSGTDHFDAWQVLKDEYAKERGFDYQPGGSYVDDESENSHNQFQIIGTSADDKSSHPHVVSPPLLDSIMTHLPDVSLSHRIDLAPLLDIILTLVVKFPFHSTCTTRTTG
jgi:hypothetical protein